MDKKKFQTVLVQALLTEQQENAVGQLGKKFSFYCFYKRERVFYVFFFFLFHLLASFITQRNVTKPLPPKKLIFLPPHSS